MNKLGFSLGVDVSVWMQSEAENISKHVLGFILHSLIRLSHSFFHTMQLPEDPIIIKTPTIEVMT